MFEHCIESGTDFYEMGSGSLFHIGDYAQKVRNGEEPEGILVTDGFGTYLGYVPASKVDSIIKQNKLHPKWMNKKEI